MLVQPVFSWVSNEVLVIETLQYSAQKTAADFSHSERLTFRYAHAVAETVAKVFIVNRLGVDHVFCSQLLHSIAVILGVVAHPKLNPPHAVAFSFCEGVVAGPSFILHAVD